MPLVIYDECGLPVEIVDGEELKDTLPRGLRAVQVKEEEAARIAPKLQWEEFIVSADKQEVRAGKEVKILIWYNRAMKLKRKVAKIEIIHDNVAVREEIPLKEHRGVKHVVYTYYTFTTEAGNYKVTVSLDNGLSKVVEIEAV